MDSKFQEEDAMLHINSSLCGPQNVWIYSISSSNTSSTFKFIHFSWSTMSWGSSKQSTIWQSETWEEKQVYCNFSRSCSFWIASLWLSSLFFKYASCNNSLSQTNGFYQKAKTWNYLWFCTLLFESSPCLRGRMAPPMKKVSNKNFIPMLECHGVC